MVNIVTNTRVALGNRSVIQQIQIASDGSEETDLVVYDSSAVAAALFPVRTNPLNCAIRRIMYSTSSKLAVVRIKWDATADVLAWAMPAGGDGVFDFSSFGALKNPAGTGITGDIMLTTTGLEAGDSISLILEVDPGL